MKYLDVTFDQPDWMRHPLQRFIADGDAVEREELLTWQLLRERNVEFALFWVEGNRRRYRAAIDGVESVVSYDLMPVDDDSFYVYLEQASRPEDHAWRAAFAERRLVVVPPVVYDADARMRMTVVGRGEDLHALLDDMPGEVGTTVHAVGEFDRREATAMGALTDRQFEAVTTAHDLGYFAVPREVPLSTVADALDCTESTASSLLRNAQRRLLDRVLAGYRGSE